MHMHEACICMHTLTCVHKPISRGPELYFLGPKATLFDGPWCLDPLERPKPSK